VFLKRLEIKGFKSFADSTEICLKSGINIIVGPNGCGKSNIVDAIRWVLGEANVRHLRGNKNDDVIFNGTDNKRGLGMAHVEIVLDNSDHFLPLDYSEITISRKIFRNGESEFYINKSRVRMKDVSNLFTGTGLGKKGYSIISQGELEQVLNGQAIDRRLILEEASGLIKYRQQRDEVKHRLEKTSNDLLRLNDIIAEVKQRRQELSYKADKARQYLNISQEIQQVEKKVLSSELLKCKQDLIHKKEEFQKQQSNIALLSRDFSELEKELSAEEEKLKSLQLQLSDKQNEEYQAQKAISSLEGEQRVSIERIKNRQERIQQSQADVSKYKEMLERINQDLNSRQEDYKRQEEEYRLKEEEYKKLENEIICLEKKIIADRSYFGQSKEIVFTKIQEESQLKNEIVASEERLKRIKEKKERLEIRLDEYKNKINQYKSDNESLQMQIKDYQNSLQDYDRQLAELSQQRKERLQKLHKVEEDYARLNQEEIIINNNLLSIKQMKENLSGYSAAVKSLIKAGTSGKLHGILGIPGEFIDVPEGLELAVEVAVGKGLENVVTDTVEHARQAIDFLKDNKLGRVTFLPLDLLKVKPVADKLVQQVHSINGVVGLGSRVVEFDARFKLAVEYLLGRVLIVRDLPTAIYVYKQFNYSFRIVSLEGDLVNVSGAVSGGGKPTAHNSPLMRRGEEKRLLIKQKENNQAKNSIQKKLIAMRDEIQVIENKINDLTQLRLENKMALEIKQNQVKEITLELNNSILEMEAMQKEAENLGKEISRIHLEMSEKQNQLIKMQTENEMAMAELERLKEAIDLKQREAEVFRERFSSLKEQLEMKKRELDNIKKNKVQFEQIKHSYSQSVEEAQLIKLQMEELNHQEEIRYRELREEVAKGKDNIKLLAAQITQIKKAIEESNNRIKDLRNSLTPIKEQVQALEKQGRNLELAIARIETELSAYKIKWKEKYSDTVPEDGEIMSYGQMKEFKQTIEQLSAKLAALGSIDTGSIEEFQEINKRFEFLNQQYQDLLAAKDSLNSLLAETEKLMLKNFSHFLLLANESFNKTFKAIFEGGDARLYLESGKERLEAGVEIEVKLPGKKTQVLGLLSGGERALTCIAFIFSLLRLKPAPFCVLDEIDAALDEVNLNRFAHFLQEMADKLQFIVITHRQATISIGENIYGITMPEKGVSSILTLNLAETESMAG